ncbi:response regulator transcription factor [bacterium SCSIO 12643]|nr:response regulator transcription factor [bacterium SCSIO 12643]
MITIGVVDDIVKLGLALKEKIEAGSEFEVKFVALDGYEAISYLEHEMVDCILMDINMPNLDGIKATQQILSKWPKAKVIMCTVFSDEQNLFDAIMAGAIGYLLKDEPPQKIHRSIYEALEGGAPMSPIMARKSLSLIHSIPATTKKTVREEYKLTGRETEVLEWVSKGYSYEQVAGKLYVSYGTVRKHVENCFKKLRVHNKLEAVNKLNKEGFI